MSLQRKKEAVTVSREVQIVNKLGLHARPAAEFVRRANAFRSDIWLVKDGNRFSAGSLIEIMRANLDCGATATLEAYGSDAEAAVERLSQLLVDLRDRYLD
jgi:phosphocarrier protein HPr